MQKKKRSIDHADVFVHVVGDSKILIESINGVTPFPWRIKFLVRDVLTIASLADTIIFKHILREANFVALQLLLLVIPWRVLFTFLASLLLQLFILIVLEIICVAVVEIKQIYFTCPNCLSR